MPDAGRSSVPKCEDFGAITTAQVRDIWFSNASWVFAHFFYRRAASTNSSVGMVGTTSAAFEKSSVEQNRGYRRRFFNGAR
jgi:hypothetical protein